MSPTRRRTDPARSQSGFSLAEITVLLAVIGALFTLSLPTFLTYYQSAQVRAAAADIAAYVLQGRQIAILQNTNTCVHVRSTTVHYHLGAGPCTDPTQRWVGAGTDSNGEINLPDGITLTATANPSFNNLGAAAPAATITVSSNTNTLNVTVSAAGRVTVGP